MVGLLVHFWAWADSQLEIGDAPSVTLAFADEHTGVTGFAKALVEMGWLKPVGEGFSIPNFERHMSETAKRRALTTERNRKSRRKNVTHRASRKRLPEKRREDVDDDAAAASGEGGCKGGGGQDANVTHRASRDLDQVDHFFRFELCATEALAAELGDESLFAAYRRLGTTPEDCELWRTVLAAAKGHVRNPKAFVRSRALRFRRPEDAGESYDFAKGDGEIEKAIRRFHEQNAQDSTQGGT